MTTLTPRLQIAAMLLQGVYASPKNIGDHHRARNFALQEADALIAECGGGEANDCKYCEQTLRQEERATEWADKLANEIASKLHVDIGEHSSSNCPWENALEAIEDYEPTQPRKVEVTDEMVERFAENYIGAGHTEPTLRGALNYIINGAYVPEVSDV
ncbi:hypothetical protein V3390_09430 [Luteimonas sp. FXH3W]|uniref:Uncharacterized protein n=1 Tax=Aquilutibacter rugosus TaxID=3115820 RepID=A0ABU7V2Y2_9GAMM